MKLRLILIYVCIVYSVLLAEETVFDDADNQQHIPDSFLEFKEDLFEEKDIDCISLEIPEEIECQPYSCPRQYYLVTNGGVLYWQAMQDYMDIAFQAPSATANDCCGTSFHNGKIVSLSTPFHLGLEVGLEMRSCSDNDLFFFVNYTLFNMRNNKSCVMNPGGFLYARWIQPNLICNNVASQISMKWNFDFQLLNLECEKKYQWNCYSLNMHSGILSAIINQKIKGKIDLLEPQPQELTIKGRSHSIGIGPRIGIENHWGFCQFFFITDLSASLLFTHYKLKNVQNGDPTVFLTASNHINTLRPEMDLNLGLGWDGTRAFFDVRYTFQVWWNQNMLRWFSDLTYLPTSQGNLYIQGLEAKFGVKF